MQPPASCCPSRPAHSRSRAFFRAAATLALVAGSLSGSLSANGGDYLNPLGNTSYGFVHNDGGNILFTNHGTIDTAGMMGMAAVLQYVSGSITTLTNTGLIRGAGGTMDMGGGDIMGENGSGIFCYTNGGVIGTINNSGTITGIGGNGSGSMGMGGQGSGIYQYTSGAHIDLINNTGVISGVGGTAAAFAPVQGGFGIYQYAGSTYGTINNSGSITGTTSGIYNGSGCTITAIINSGIISGGTHAIENDGTIGTLTVLAGAQFNGGILNSGTIGTLNVSVVATSANFDAMGGSAPVITGNQPLATNQTVSAPTSSAFVSVGNRTAGVDTSAFGANTNAIRHVSNSVGRLANTNGVIQSIGTKIAKHNADPYVMTSDLCADGAPAQPGQIGNSDFWIRGFMGRNRVDATASSVDYINTYSGGAVGIERDWSEDVRAGAFIGAGITDNSLGGALGGSEADLLFAGAYATKTWGTLFAKVGLTGGRGNNTGTRNIAAATPETATADYNSWYVSPEVSVGKVYDLGQRLGGTLSVTPVLSVRYVYAHQDGYTETGATNNLTMNNSHSTTIEERAELKFSYATKAFNDYGVKINASVGGIGQQNNGGAMSGTLLGAPLSFATPGDDNTTGFVGGLGFEINRGKYTFTASGDYVRLSGGNADLSANVVFSVKF